MSYFLFFFHMHIENRTTLLFYLCMIWSSGVRPHQQETNRQTHPAAFFFFALCFLLSSSVFCLDLCILIGPPMWLGCRMTGLRCSWHHHCASWVPSLCGGMRSGWAACQSASHVACIGAESMWRRSDGGQQPSWTNCLTQSQRIRLKRKSIHNEIDINRKDGGHI